MLSAVGLLLDIVGAVLIFAFAVVPKVSSEPPYDYIILEQVDEEAVAKAKSKAERYERISALGICLLAVGFLFQLLGNEYVQNLNW